jgi:alginate O-acetyltransferase complex protein AlgI
VLLVASLIFYGSWSLLFLGLLCVSITVDYFVSHAIARAPTQGKKRTWLLLSLLVNLGILAGFKYADFFLDNWVALLALFGLGDGLREPFGFILPLGISFYTFQTLSYTIDVYRGVLRPMVSLRRYALYMTFFMHLIAGPILRVNELAPQLETARTLASADAYRGVSRILLGLLKKVVLADWLAAVVEPVFSAPHEHAPLSSLIAVYGYAFQIFLDFSGYCDIAVGSALLLGFRLPENFFTPYLARNLTEFWRRWHVTLSSWLRDYLYVPLGGNRRGSIRTYLNLLTTMLLGGLWHGASWNFVIWGGIHGLLLAAHRAVRARFSAPRGRVWELVSIFATFQLVCLAWIFFRCGSFAQARAMLAALGGLRGSELVTGLLLAVGLLLGYAACVRLTHAVLAWAPARVSQELAYGLGAGLVILCVSLFSAPGAEFIYFQF